MRLVPIAATDYARSTPYRRVLYARAAPDEPEEREDERASWRDAAPRLRHDPPVGGRQQDLRAKRAAALQAYRDRLGPPRLGLKIDARA